MLQVIERLDHSSKIKVSVAAIIRLYNGSPFIRESLRSVLAQTEPADEIIVVDDGSTDDVPEIVKEMAAQYPIRLITKTNGGIGAARIDRHGRMVRRNFLDEVLSQHPKTSLRQCLSQDMFILPGASLFTKDAFGRVGGFDERLSGYEDDDLFLRMFAAGFGSVYLRKNAVMKWRIYPTSTSYSPRMAKSRMIYFHKLIEAYPDDPALKVYWARDCIGPRFFNFVRTDFIEGLRLRDRPRLKQAWSDIQEVVPVMRERMRRRMKLVAPLISLTYRTPFARVARRLLPKR